MPNNNHGVTHAIIIAGLSILAILAFAAIIIIYLIAPFGGAS